MVLSAENVEKMAGPWMGFAEIIEGTGLAMTRIAVLMAVASTAFDKEKRWMQDHKKMLSKDEIRIIHSLDSWLSGKMIWQTEEKHISIGDLDLADRIQRVLDEIQGRIKKIEEAFESSRCSLF